MPNQSSRNAPDQLAADRATRVINEWLQDVQGLPIT